MPERERERERKDRAADTRRFLCPSRGIAIHQMGNDSRVARSAWRAVMLTDNQTNYEE